MKASERGIERVHPTQKPIALMAWCIQGLGDPRTILDPYMGSGTTGIAAVQRGCGFIGIELNARYFDAACKRIEEAHAQGRLFSSEPQKPEQGELLGAA